jgi:DNA-binding protein HU-beta
MNKTELARAISTQVDLSQAKAAKTINIILQEITQILKKGDKVTFIGFGSFSVSKRAARTERNPRTGAILKSLPEMP